MSGLETTSRLGVNVHWLLENRIRRNKSPIGDKNNVNLVYDLPDNESAHPDTLEVFLSHLKLTPNMYELSEDGKSFTIVLAPTDAEALHKPPQQYEQMSVNYLLRMGGP